jgi:hypothetical protein
MLAKIEIPPGLPEISVLNTKLSEREIVWRRTTEIAPISCGSKYNAI